MYIWNIRSLKKKTNEIKIIARTMRKGERKMEKMALIAETWHLLCKM